VLYLDVIGNNRKYPIYGYTEKNRMHMPRMHKKFIARQSIVEVVVSFDIVVVFLVALA